MLFGHELQTGIDGVPRDVSVPLPCRHTNVIQSLEAGNTRVGYVPHPFGFVVLHRSTWPLSRSILTTVHAACDRGGGTQ